MNNQIFDDFERTEFSDEIFAILGRALTVATRFDASTKTLARLPSFKLLPLIKSKLDDDEYEKILEKISSKYKNLNRAIESLQPKEDNDELLRQARESRNELIHEASLGATKGFDYMNGEELTQRLTHIECLVLQIIKGESIISTIISVQNKESISAYPFSKEYESKYVNWVMERFKK